MTINIITNKANHKATKKGINIIQQLIRNLSKSAVKLRYFWDENVRRHVLSLYFETTLDY